MISYFYHLTQTHFLKTHINIMKGDRENEKADG